LRAASFRKVLDIVYVKSSPNFARRKITRSTHKSFADGGV